MSLRKSGCLGRGLKLAALLLSLLGATRAAASYEGYGSSSVGGAGGDTYHVTALTGSGPGTLEYGVENRTGPRTIVFDVGGTLVLDYTVRIDQPYLTIDGATAPAPGITIRPSDFDAGADSALVIEGTHDIIIRGLRLVGYDTGGDADLVALDGAEEDVYNVVIDHLSLTAADDGALDITGNVHDVTVSWCLLYGNERTSLIKYDTRQRISIHHNVYAHNGERNPQVKGDMSNLDFRNNIVYDWKLTGDGYGLLLWSAASESDSPGAPSVNVVGNAFIAKDEQDGCGIEVVEDSLPVQRWVEDNIALPSPLCVSSNLADPIAIPGFAQVTTWPAVQLAGKVLPAAGMKFRNAPEEALLDEIGRVPVWDPTLVLTSPNGGETWVMGSVHSITWKAMRLQRRGTVQISIDDGVSVTQLASVSSTQTSYLWTISNAPTTGARIRLENRVSGIPEASDSSDDAFSVVAPAGPPPLGYFTLTPCRLVDTRYGDAPPLAAGSDRRFRLTGHCGIPATAKALAVNMGVTGGTAVGHLVLYPAGDPVPPTSALNYSPEVTRSNNGIVSLGPEGALAVHCGQSLGTVDFILDVSGYFE